MPIKAEWKLFDPAVCRMCPEDAGVYEIGYAANGTVVYVGKSDSSIKSRLMWHIQRRDFVGVTHFRFRKTEDAAAAECRLLREYKRQHGRLPHFNKAMPPYCEDPSPRGKPSAKPKTRRPPSHSQPARRRKSYSDRFTLF